MRENILERLGTLVTTVMFVVLGIIGAICLFLILRGRVFGPLRFRWPRRKKSAEKEEGNRQRRRRLRLWFWDRD